MRDDYDGALEHPLPDGVSEQVQISAQPVERIRPGLHHQYEHRIRVFAQPDALAAAKRIRPQVVDRGVDVRPQKVRHPMYDRVVEPTVSAVDDPGPRRRQGQVAHQRLGFHGFDERVDRGDEILDARA
ncbi:hypothetical protein [Rhodococcus sp. 3A]|uniref:hypothetical protein n=1 Tax=Rhodococcus sp. 3A TaxID=2834581 RepID=UPI001639A8D5|nr:hypothetical protein [Rhodococcus sp. 3A]MBC2644299.1 hypothetical protein [Rhodococcus sp. 3A]